LKANLESQVTLIVLFGFMSFGTSSFWVSLYMQNVLRYSPLEVAVHLLPQAVVGILVNVIAGLVLHKISNRVLMGIGSVAYFGAALLLALMKGEHVYWPFIAPALGLAVIGADLQFNVANVSLPAPT
jgi:nitrate/nitrite transporter NarK